jgi:hypothetical protein
LYSIVLGTQTKQARTRPPNTRISRTQGKRRQKQAILGYNQMRSLKGRLRSWSQNNDAATPRKSNGMFSRNNSNGSNAESFGKPPRTPDTREQVGGGGGVDDSGDDIEGSGAKSARSSFGSLRRLSGRLLNVGSGIRSRANSLSSMRSMRSFTSSGNEHEEVGHVDAEPATPRSRAAFFKWTDTPRNMLRRSGGAKKSDAGGKAEKQKQLSSSPRAAVDGGNRNRSSKQSRARKAQKRTMNSLAHAYGAAEMQDSLVRYRRVVAGNNETAIHSGAQLADFLDCPSPLADAPFVKNLKRFTHKHLSSNSALAASTGKGGGIDIVTALRLETVIHMRDDPYAREKCASACLSAMGMDDEGCLSRETLHDHLEQIRTMIESEAKAEDESDSNPSSDDDIENRKARRKRRGGNGGGGGRGAKWVDAEWRNFVRVFKDGRDHLLTQLLLQKQSSLDEDDGKTENGSLLLAGVDRDLQTYVRLKVFLAEHAPDHLENLPLTMDKNTPKVSVECWNCTT